MNKYQKLAVKCAKKDIESPTFNIFNLDLKGYIRIEKAVFRDFKIFEKCRDYCNKKIL